MAPATPITSERLLTRPSEAPKTTARSVPAPPRCQRSERVISSGAATFRARRVASTCVAAAIAEPTSMVAAGTCPQRRGSQGPSGRRRAWRDRDRRRDLLGRRRSAFLEALPGVRVGTLVGRDCGGLVGGWQASVDPLLGSLQRADHLGHGARSEHARGEEDDPDAGPRAARGGRDRRAERLETGAPDGRMPALVAGDRPEHVDPGRHLLDRGQGVVEQDRVLLEPEAGEALGEIGRTRRGGGRGCHAGNRTGRRDRHVRRPRERHNSAHVDAARCRRDAPALAQGRRGREPAPRRSPTSSAWPRRPSSGWPPGPSSRRRSASTRALRRASRTRCRRSFAALRPTGRPTSSG